MKINLHTEEAFRKFKEDFSDEYLTRDEILYEVFNLRNQIACLQEDLALTQKELEKSNFTWKRLSERLDFIEDYPIGSTPVDKVVSEMIAKFCSVIE